MEQPEQTTPFRFGRNDYLISFAFWTLYAAVTAANFLSNDHEPAGVRRAVPEAVYWFYHSYVWALATPFMFWLVWRYTSGRSGRRLLLGAGVGILVLVSLLHEVVWEQVLGFPPHRNGFLSGFMRLDDEAITCAAIFAVGFLREQTLRSRARKAQLAKARLSLLRSQLNPHFLFNSLNALSTLVEDDPRGAQRMIAWLSELLRFALEAREDEEIPLDQELMLTERYLQILQIRYQGRLTTRLSAGIETRDALVPNLILQPLVENAMKHGVGKAGGRGSIEVEVRHEGESLVLTVTDSGGGTGASERSEPGLEGSGTGLGLHNTRARLRELYGSEQSLRLLPAPGGGMVAEIVIPFRRTSR